MNLPGIAIVLNWRGEVNKKGLYSIHIRVTIDRVSKYYLVKIPSKIARVQWSGKENAWIKNTHPFSFEINEKLKEKINDINELVRRQYLLNKPVTFQMVEKQLKVKQDLHSFTKYMDAYIKNPPDALHENTLKKYRTCLKKLVAFKGDVMFTEIDNAFVHGFMGHMVKVDKLAGAAIKKYMDAFKKVLKAARRDNFIDQSQLEFLFDDIKISTKRTTKRVFLDVDEIKKWKAVKFNASEVYLERDRDMFLFQVYTGYYYNDLKIFKKSQLVMDKDYGHFIIGERDKNGNETIIPLFKFPHAAYILKKYAADAKAPLVFDASTFIEDQVYNRHLKTIAQKAGIDKVVVNKTGRHTHAQLYVRYGAKTQVLSKIMGHTKSDTTKHYYEMNLPEIVEGTKNVDFQKLGI